MTEFINKINKIREYCDYLEEHYNNVQSAFNTLSKRLDRYEAVDFIDDDYTYVYSNFNIATLQKQIEQHDLSKLSVEEFVHYRQSFYPISEEEKENSKELFESAWEHHKQNNPHHWQGRLCKHDDYNNEFNDTIENVCDWIGMSYKFGKEIDKYYLENNHKMTLSDNSKRIIETVFKIMKDERLV